MDWSIESGWFIITIIVGILAIVSNIIQIAIKPFLNWLRERRLAKEHEIAIKFLDFVAILSYTVKGTSPNTIRICAIKLNFDVKNLGNESTTVKIFEAKFKVLGIDGKEYIAQNLSKSNFPFDLEMKPLKIEIKANGKENNHLNFQTLANSSYFKEAWIKLKFKFLDKNADYNTEETDWEVVEIRNFNLT